MAIGISFTIAWPNLAASIGTQTYSTKIDFNQTFGDAAAGYRDFDLSVGEKLRAIGWSPISVTLESVSGSLTGVSINRQRKSDRLDLKGINSAGSTVSIMTSAPLVG